MTTATRLRIGDTERHAAASALAEHYAAGRLDREEYDQRSDQALRARTDTDLSPLFDDLPSLHTVKESQERPTRRAAPRAFGFPRLPVLPFLALALLLVVLLPGPPWPLFLVGSLWFLGVFGRRRPHGHRSWRLDPLLRVPAAIGPLLCVPAAIGPLLCVPSNDAWAERRTTKAPPSHR